MAVQIGAKPDSGFDDPIGMLTDCHRRIERFLDILCIVAERAAGRMMTGEESEAIQAALQYFHVGGQRHNADEEQSLFPRLREASTGEEFTEIHGLESDHEDATRLHELVEQLYAMWITGGELGAEDQSNLQSATRGLKRLYEEHIRIEEQVVFPRAAKVLDRQAIQAIGEEFRARRA
jgi:hemerythrin-like domain-containing protein